MRGVPTACTSVNYEINQTFAHYGRHSGRFRLSSVGEEVFVRWTSWILVLGSLVIFKLKRINNVFFSFQVNINKILGMNHSLDPRCVSTSQVLIRGDLSILTLKINFNSSN